MRSLSLFSFLFALSVFVLPMQVSAGSALQDIRNSINETSQAADLGDNPASQGSGQKTITSLLKNIINIFVGVLGVIAVTLMVYAGGLWLTSAGNDQKVSTAKTIIQSTIIGIIIVSLAYAITTFVITQLASAG